ncbi:MAG: epoxyqueuosine reductase QueH [bacterium]|nr:epoxyqueuosine reductase QueH [bacterium]
MKILLHICCGVCASSVMERLKEEGFEVIGFFYNPNIHPGEEYKRRLEITRQVAHILDFPLVEGVYDKENWFKLTAGLENEPEGGSRCAICFGMRLEKTREKASELDIPYFTTTLTVSPHKNAMLINKIGKELGAENFIERDFKKMAGAKLAMEFARRHNFYRQNYCGCASSMKSNQK